MSKKDERARLDADGKARPKTKLIKKVNPGHCVGPYANAKLDAIELRHDDGEVIHIHDSSPKVIIIDERIDESLSLPIQSAAESLKSLAPALTARHRISAVYGDELYQSILDAERGLQSLIARLQEARNNRLAFPSRT